MSISSISNPTALLSQVTGKNPFAVATPFGAASFASTLLQELRQSGASTAASSAAGTTSASAAGAGTAAAGANTPTATGGTATTGALQAHGHRHHGGGMSQLISLLQQNQTSGSAASTAASSGTSSLQLQALLQNLKNGASASPGQLLRTSA